MQSIHKSTLISSRFFSALAIITVGILQTGPFSAVAAKAASPCTARIVIAHQGYQANDAGDTVESQVAAYNLGANGADSDLWKTRMPAQGGFVQRHDNDLATSTNGTGNITDRTLGYITSLYTTQHHQKVPQLIDSLALSQFKESNRYLQFEIKWSVKGYGSLDAIDQQIKAADMSKHVVLYSDYLDSLQYLRTKDADLILMYKSEKVTPPISDLKGLNGAVIFAGYIHKPDVDAYHKAGLQIWRANTNAVETETGWRNFVNVGADGIMTDHPETIIPWCKQL